MLTPKELFAKYDNRVFISAEELQEYRGIRSPDLKLLVLRIRNVRKYDEPKVLSNRMTMVGMGLSKEQYFGLRATKIKRSYPIENSSVEKVSRPVNLGRVSSLKIY